MKLIRQLIELILRGLSSKQIPPTAPVGLRSLAWGRHPQVTPEFRRKAFSIADSLGMAPDHLMACMAFETGGTFNPAEKNKAGSGATGLIQFMPKTAIGLGTSVEALALLTAEEQLDVVHRYFKPYAGRLKTLSDVYMAILWPAGIGKPENWVLWDKTSRPTTYRQNAGLDIDKDGAIRKAEAAAHVQRWLERGLLPENRWGGA